MIIDFFPPLKSLLLMGFFFKLQGAKVEIEAVAIVGKLVDTQ